MDDILLIRTPGVCFYALRDRNRLALIDTGFIGGWPCLQRQLRRRGWLDLPIKMILLTHGHLDHIFNARRLQERTGAQIVAPSLDREHYIGKYPYRGWARICGALEAVGRAIFRFRDFSVDHWLSDGDVVDIWDGLEVIHLPGHTVGHTGYYSRSRKLLFSGDFFASYGYRNFIPPAFLNSCPNEFPHSFARILDMDIDYVFPNHGDRALPQVHRERLFCLARKHCDHATKPV